MTKFNQIFQLTTVLLCAAVGSSAQSVRSCDLTVTINSPGNNEIIQPNDTSWLEFTITNSGPDPILSTDTLWFFDQTTVFPFLALTDIPKDGTKSYTRSELNMSIVNNNAGATSDFNTQLCMKLVNQSTIFYSATTGPLVTFEDPDTANNWSCVNITFEGTDTDPSDISTIRNTSEAFLSIYPNPASDEVNLSVNSEKIENITLKIVDLKGREVMRRDYEQVQPGPTPLKLNIAALPDGMYFIELHTEVTKSREKLIINNF